MKGKFKADRRLSFDLACGCCSSSEWQEEEFNTLQDAYDYVSDCYEWNIYLEDVLVLKS
jgi:hypothetical protein